MNTTSIIISIIALIIGIVIGKSSSIDILSIDKKTEELEELTEHLTKVTEEIDFESIHELQAINTYDSYIEILSNIEQSNINEIERVVLENLGNFYYNYTYEDLRDMNSEGIESCLKQIEEKSQNSELFKKVINYKPDQ